jgi:hypothetical protein
MTTGARRIIRIPIRRGTHGILGVGLIAYGLLGIGLISVALLFLGGRIAAAGGTETGEDLNRTLQSSRDALREASAAVRGADTGLASAAVAAGSAGEMMGELSMSLRGLASALRISILGAQPFAGPAADFDRLADRASELGDDLEAVRASVSLAATDTSRLAQSIDRLELRMGDLQSSVDLATADGFAAARLLLATLLLWLAVPAVISLWLGIRWSRPRRRAPSR